MQSGTWTDVWNRKVLRRRARKQRAWAWSWGRRTRERECRSRIVSGLHSACGMMMMELQVAMLVLGAGIAANQVIQNQGIQMVTSAWQQLQVSLLQDELAAIVAVDPLLRDTLISGTANGPLCQQQISTMQSIWCQHMAEQLPLSELDIRALPVEGSQSWQFEFSIAAPDDLGNSRNEGASGSGMFP